MFPTSRAAAARECSLSSTATGQQQQSLATTDGKSVIEFAEVQTPKDRSRASCSESSSDPHPETLESARQKKWSHRSSRKDEKFGILPSRVLIYSKSRIFLAPPATDMELAGRRVTPLGVHLRLTTRLARLACSGAS
nr:hypothetical protein Iba_chr04cCG12780 [Ipomoea batatas]